MSPRFVADENIARDLVLELRAQAWDVLSIGESYAGGADIDVLACACRENRWLLTHDRDYGQLIFQQQKPAPPGVIYLRTGHWLPSENLLAVVSAFSHFGTRRVFVTVGHLGDVRVRDLPVHDGHS